MEASDKVYYLPGHEQREDDEPCPRDPVQSSAPLLRDRPGGRQLSHGEKPDEGGHEDAIDRQQPESPEYNH